MTTAIESALRDPEGARAAILSYGREWSFPPCTLGGMEMREGERGWRESVSMAEPLHLGLAWQGVEQLGEHPPKRQAFKQAPRPTRLAPDRPTATRKETNVPVLAWKENTPALDPGIYPARVSEIIEEEGQFGPQLRFQFIVLDDDGRDTVGQIRGWCSAKWGVKTKLLDWAKALLRAKCPKENEPIDTDQLVGRRCDIEVEHKQTEKGASARIVQLYAYRTMSAISDDDDSAPAAAPKRPAAKDEVPF